MTDSSRIGGNTLSEEISQEIHRHRRNQLTRTGLSAISIRVLHAMDPGRLYNAKDVAELVGISEHFSSMHLARMAERRHLDLHRTPGGWQRHYYALPGTAGSTSRAAVRAPARLTASNLGQVIGRLLLQLPD